ncbi:MULTISPECIES: prepilin-type N-terminal cleavage/methylation domain-containing protein [Geobacillus]|uniref:prepilin-type N-terminal cleavage/methylation domain-containing protein n=1 Tax=Geobacillus TaxID=129337 RepID=UPI0004A0D7E5|nr:MULTISPECIES: prepilin-type N-terminal cleavage/methylation domain-containing protein [Geobacillus]KDE47438.1 N-terminal cleavage protein [Geobacillus sp. CAMR5420]
MLKRIIKNERGLTLIELLAVIVILGIIAAIAIPAIGAIMDNSKKDAHIANAQQIVSAARLAVTADKNTQSVYTLQQLYDGGYLENIPKSPGKVSTKQYHATESKVEIVQKTDSNNKVIGIEYHVKLVDNDGKHVYIKGDKDASDLTRDDVDLN